MIQSCMLILEFTVYEILSFSPPTPPPPLPTPPPQEFRSAMNIEREQLPFASFCHMFSNASMLEASAAHPAIHIVDFGSHHSSDWPSLLTQLATRQNQPPPQIRITIVDSSASSGADTSMSRTPLCAGGCRFKAP